MGTAKRNAKASLRRMPRTDPKHKLLVSRIFRDISTLVRARRKLPFSLDWVDLVGSIIRGDPPANSATLSFPSSGGVTVTVTVESNRSEYFMYATQNTTTLGDAGTEKAYSSTTPSANQLTYLFRTYDANAGVGVQLSFSNGTSTQVYEILFSAGDVAAGNEINLAMNPV